MGERIGGRFTTEALAGRGGMGAVYRARDAETEKPVAVKMVDAHRADDRFEREARVLADLTHDAIVRYVAHGDLDDGRMYLAMEWIDGEPLDARLARGPLPIAEAVALVRRLADALGTAHARGVVHRDVKPSNVMLRGGRTNDPVLVDFGIARVARTELRESPATRTGVVLGTPAYMAPEQVRAAKALGPRADVFSLGCVLFECLVGRPAFLAEHVFAVLAKILFEPAPRVSATVSQVSPQLDALVASMLDKDEERRPRDGDAVREALAHLTDRGPAPEGGPPAPVGLAERRLVTVLLAERRAPRAIEPDSFVSTDAALADLTAEEAMREAPAALGLTLVSLPGGRMAAALLANEAATDYAARMARCALLLRQHDPAVTVAIATGRGVPSRELPVGDAIDRAAELLDQTRTPGVFVDEATASLVDARFEIARDGPCASLLRERPAHERIRTVLGRVTPCVGRDRELTILSATFEECASEPVARAVLVVAPSGVGKSRLQRELSARVSGQAGVWLGLADPLMERAPYALASELLRRVSGIAEGDPPARRRERLRALSSETRTVAALGELVGAAFDDADDEPLRAARRDPALMSGLVERAFTALLAGASAKRPLLVVLEDVHWADAPSLRLFTAALERRRDLPLMVLALARPSVDDVHPKLWETQGCLRLVLEPLLRRAAEKLARALLGDHPDVELVVARAAGNALFVEELARLCAEGRPKELPASVAAATEARLATLEPEARLVLRAASVLGERFWPGAVARLVQMAPHAIDAAVKVLEQAELIAETEESRFSRERELAFRHAVVRDAAYAMLPDEDRTRAHAAAAGWLEERVEDAPALARHYDLGGIGEKAASWYVVAAEEALAAQDFDAVHAHVDRARACGAAGAVLGQGELARAEALFWNRDNRRAAEAADAAGALLPAGSAAWFVAMGLVVASRGKLGQRQALLVATDLLERTDAGDAGARRTRAIAGVRAAMQLAYFGEIARADRLVARAATEAADDVQVQAWLLDAEFERAWISPYPVDPSIPARARALYERIGDRRSVLAQAFNQMSALVVLRAEGEAEALIEDLERAGGAPAVFRASLEGFRAYVRGDVEKIAANVATIAKGANPRDEGSIVITYAAALYRAGRLVEARAEVERALVLTSETPAFHCVALAVRSRVRLATADASGALADAEAAVRTAERGVSVFGSGLLPIAHVEALKALGREDDARAALARAAADVRSRAERLPRYKDGFLATLDNPTLLRMAEAAELG